MPRNISANFSRPQRPRTSSIPQPLPQTPTSPPGLYQYHNAPEVAPAHGLEYDDTVYPSSDKYPVVHSNGSIDYHGKALLYDHGTRPPRIIFGMKVKTFVAVAVLFILIIVGASVGGAIGGRNMHGGNTSGQISTLDGVGTNATVTSAAASASAAAASSSSTPQTSSATSSAAIPTFSPLSACANNTLYTPSKLSTTSSSAQFTRYCGYASPLTSTNTIAEAFMYTLSDCIDLCAGFNVYGSASSNCTVAVYSAGASRPGNCWVGYGVEALSELKVAAGVDVALLAS